VSLLRMSPLVRGHASHSVYLVATAFSDGSCEVSQTASQRFYHLLNVKGDSSLLITQ
jgi:hypothetical protein